MSALFAAPEPNAVVLWSPLTTSLPVALHVAVTPDVVLADLVAVARVIVESRMSPPAATAPSPEAVELVVRMTWSTSPPSVSICWFTELSTDVSRSST